MVTVTLNENQLARFVHSVLHDAVALHIVLVRFRPLSMTWEPSNFIDFVHRMS